MKKNTTTKKATSKKTKFKLEAKREEKMFQILEQLEEDGDEEAGGKIKQILTLYVKGFSPKEIIAIGYNRTTVYRQTNDFKKLQKAPALEYYGYELFESRVRKYMSAKKATRDKAVAALMEKDLA